MAHEFKVRNGLIIGIVAGTTAVDRILDEDDMVSDSATALATQQSIKAYVDAINGSNIGTAGTGVFKQKTATNQFEFYKLNSLSGNLTINLDAANNKIDFDVSMVDFDFQESVIDFYDPTTSTPPTPTTGDRYIASATANGWTANNIYEWDGSAWVETVADEGMLTWNETLDKFYVYNGTAWVAFGGIVAHNSLSGLQGGNGVDEYYHLNATDHGDLTDVNAQLAELQTDGTPTFANIISSGYLRVGDTTDETAGNIRINSSIFQGYNGTEWVDLHADDDDFHNLVAVTDIQADDELLIWDASNSGYRRITKDDLFSGFSGNSGEVTGITAATTVDSFADTAGKAVEWDYVVQDGTNYRMGQVGAVWNATTDAIEFYEVGTIDIGDTDGVVFTVDIDTDTVRLRCTPASGTWTVSYNRELIGA